jgi:hypothetical protein
MANILSTSQPDELLLGEEELFDVSLSTFHVFDKENVGASPPARNLRGGPCTPGIRSIYRE